MSLSFKQKAINLHARFVQKPALAWLPTIKMLRLAEAVNARLMHKVHRDVQLCADPAFERLTRTRPSQSMPEKAVLYLHGGAFIIGSFRGYRAVTAGLAKAGNLDVHFLEYPLAPEHPYPAAIDDASAALTHLQKTYGSKNVSIVADSAGGGIALGLVHRLLHEDRALPARVVLFSPVSNLSDPLPSMERNKRKDALLSPRFAMRGARAYAGTKDATNPEISPMLGDFTGAPPMLFQVDQTECLYDHSIQMVEVLRRQSVEVTLSETNGLIHDYQLYAGVTSEADRAVQQAADFINA